MLDLELIASIYEVIVMNELVINDTDLIENPTPRVPVVLCLDTSWSMSGPPIEELAEGVNLFYQSIFDDEFARYSVEICVVTFGNDGVQRVAEFGPVERPPDLRFYAEGTTPMGEAVSVSLDNLEERKQQYKVLGVDYFQPWLVLMTDGAPTDNIDEAVERVTILLKQKKLSVFPVGIGKEADMDVLAKFSPGRDPLRLRGLEFRNFFEWLGKSVQKVSASAPGQRVTLDFQGIKGWAEV